MKQIPEDLSKEDIKALPLESFPGEIITVGTDEELAEALERIKDCTLLGFDTETRPSFKKGQSNPVSLLQFATEDCAILVRLKGIQDYSPISKVLENPTIIKTGVAIHDDIKALHKMFSFESAGFIDSGKMAIKLGFKKSGLRNLAATLLKIRISKSAQLSNWAKEELTDSQKKYAATDAWISRCIYKSLQGYLQ